jgi:glycosyltransferase involved in cell wall biosynthesis
VDWNQIYVQRSHRSDIKLIYVGAISEQKGILTLIRSIFFLNQRRSGQVKLTIVGTGSSLEEMKVRSLISQMSLEGLVKIVGYRPNRDLPRFLVKHDALVFPSIIEEGFGRVAAEAMAAGLAVIGSGTGGSAEIIEHEVTGLRFQPGDPINLARQIGFLMDSASLFVQVSAAGQRYVQSNFGLNRMIEEVENFLLKTCEIA